MRHEGLPSNVLPCERRSNLVCLGALHENLSALRGPPPGLTSRHRSQGCPSCSVPCNRIKRIRRAQSYKNRQSFGPKPVGEQRYRDGTRRTSEAGGNVVTRASLARAQGWHCLRTRREPRYRRVKPIEIRLFRRHQKRGKSLPAIGRTLKRSHHTIARWLEAGEILNSGVDFGVRSPEALRGHAAFVGLRIDKRAAAVRRETPT